MSARPKMNSAVPWKKVNKVVYLWKVSLNQDFIKLVKEANFSLKTSKQLSSVKFVAIK